VPCAGCAAALADAGSSTWTNYVFYLSPFRFWQLATGALLHLSLSLHPAHLAPLLRGGPLVAHAMTGVALLIFVLGFLHDSGDGTANSQLWWAVGATFGSVLFILSWAPSDDAPSSPPFFNALCSTTPMRYIGKISYQLCARRDDERTSRRPASCRAAATPPAASDLVC
jgi:peptidoglycan/LPS O-acetylase OafA/YrhL